MLPFARAFALLASLGMAPTVPVGVVHQPGIGNALARNGYTDRTMIWINDAGAAFNGERTDPIVLAGILAHEQYHVALGSDECAAYTHEAGVLERLGADARARRNVERARLRFCK